MEPGIQGSVILAGDYHPFLMYAGDNTPVLYIIPRRRPRPPQDGVAHGVDAGDPPFRDHQADRRVELASKLDPAGGRTVQPHSANHSIRRDRSEAGEESRHPLAAVRSARPAASGHRPPERG
jgi:hypothetical protein